MNEKKQRLLDFLEKLTSKVTEDLKDDSECDHDGDHEECHLIHDGNIADLSIKIEHMKYRLANLLNKNEKEKYVYLNIVNNALSDVNNYLLLAISSLKDSQDEYADNKKDFTEHLKRNIKIAEEYFDEIRKDFKKG